MSAYGEFVTEFKEQGYLVKALEQLGYVVEVHAQAQALQGYMGDTRKQTADVIIRREHVGAASNDIGFAKQGDGRFSAIISDYDMRLHGHSWLEKVKQGYAEQRTLAVAHQRGYVLKRREVKDNRVQLQFTSR